METSHAVALQMFKASLAKLFRPMGFDWQALSAKIALETGGGYFSYLFSAIPTERIQPVEFLALLGGTRYFTDKGFRVEVTPNSIFLLRGKDNAIEKVPLFSFMGEAVELIVPGTDVDPAYWHEMALDIDSTAKV